MIPTTSPLARVCGALVPAVHLGRYIIIFIWGMCQPKAVLVARLLSIES